MEKKNKYVITIGFNRNEEDHRRVADILNSMNRTKAQYIVKAVLAYEQQQMYPIKGTTEETVDYGRIREYIRETVAEYAVEGKLAVKKKQPKSVKEERENSNDTEKEVEIDDAAWNGIMMSIQAFRND